MEVHLNYGNNNDFTYYIWKMKRLRIAQCNVGKFNLFSSEESLSFYMRIEDEGEIVTEGKNSAVLHYSGEAGELGDFKDNDDMSFIFDKCLSYAKRVISTTDYEGDCLLFAKTYLSDFEELNRNKSLYEKERIEKEIERLKNRLTSGELGLPDYGIEVREVLQKEIERYKEWIEQEEKEILEYKEGSEKRKQSQDRILSYQKKIAELEHIKRR